MRITRLGFTVGLVLTVACRTDGAPLRAAATARDSSGVRIVELPPLDSLELPEWNARLVFTSASIPDDELQLFRVTAAVFMEDGALVIANAGRAELAWVDAHGRLLRRVGRPGEGPGEFGRFLSALLPDPSGDLIAFDGRLSWFGADGSFRKTHPLDAPSSVVALTPLARLSNDRTLVTFGEQRVFRSSGERRDTVPLLLVDSARIDTLGTWLGLERAFATLPAGRILVPIGFAHTVMAVSNGRRTAIGSTESLDLTVYDGTPTRTMAIRGRGTPRAVGEDDIARWRRLQEAYLDDRDEMAAVVGEAWAKGPVRATPPAFEGLRIDDEGRIWIGESAGVDASERTWLVLGADGLPAARVRLPRDRPRLYPDNAELIALAGDRIALLRHSALDEERVEVWEFDPLHR